MRSADGVFHEGERRAQQLAGEERNARHNGRAISDEIVRGALPFVAAQPMLVVASADPDGWPRASLIFGEPGFARATEQSVALDLARATLDPALDANARVGADLGLLAIELATRRRFRMNGTIEERSARALRLRVREAFPNCPQYVNPPPIPTLFIASRHPTRGLDASHRGGAPGFIVRDGDRLVIPDYPGNSMFTTFGNLLVDPRVGLALVDFAAGTVNQVQGRAEVLFDRPDPDGLTKGTGRFLSVTLTS